MNRSTEQGNKVRFSCHDEKSPSKYPKHLSPSKYLDAECNNGRDLLSTLTGQHVPSTYAPYEFSFSSSFPYPLSSPAAAPSQSQHRNRSVEQYHDYPYTTTSYSYSYSQSASPYPQKGPVEIMVPDVDDIDNLASVVYSVYYKLCKDPNRVVVLFQTVGGSPAAAGKLPGPGHYVMGAIRSLCGAGFSPSIFVVDVPATETDGWERRKDAGRRRAMLEAGRKGEEARRILPPRREWRWKRKRAMLEFGLQQ